MKLLTIVGARPNFVKIAPLHHAITTWNGQAPEPIRHLVVHTGQHYDDQMSSQFFRQFELPDPDINLGIGSGSHAEQVGRAMIELEKLFLVQRPDWIVVVGDVNAALAATLAAKKLLLKVAHIEAGLRSCDWTMPEEINRVVVDRLSDLLLATGRIADANLRGEGISPDRIAIVGNIMIDTLDRHLPAARELMPEDIVERHGGRRPGLLNDFAFVTIHRPSNVDSEPALRGLVGMLGRLSHDKPVVWPLHPRTRTRLQEYGLEGELARHGAIHATDPLGYTEALALNVHASAVLTDSGGVQEEAAVLGTPCLTLRDNTERPETLVEYGGTNILTGNDPERVYTAWRSIASTERKPHRPPLWDGHTAERIVDALWRRRDAAPIGTLPDKQPS